MKKSDLTIAWRHFLSFHITVCCSLSTAVHVSITCFTVFTARIVNINMTSVEAKGIGYFVSWSLNGQREGRDWSGPSSEPTELFLHKVQQNTRLRETTSRDCSDSCGWAMWLCCITDHQVPLSSQLQLWVQLQLGQLLSLLSTCNQSIIKKSTCNQSIIISIWEPLCSTVLQHESTCFVAL